MRFIAKSPSAARPSLLTAGCANVHLSCHCADFALLYGKGEALSPFRRVFWALLARSPGRPEIGPPRPGQRLRLGPAPGRDPGVIAGQESFRDRLALELLRTGILRGFQQPFRKASIPPGSQLA